MINLRKFDPSLRVSNASEVYPVRRPEDLASARVSCQHSLPSIRKTDWM